jgi:hypothetical protein
VTEQLRVEGATDEAAAGQAFARGGEHNRVASTKRWVPVGPCGAELVLQCREQGVVVQPLGVRVAEVVERGAESVAATLERELERPLLERQQAAEVHLVSG